MILQVLPSIIITVSDNCLTAKNSETNKVDQNFPISVHKHCQPVSSVELVEFRTTVREVVGSNPSRTTTQGL